MAFNIDLKFFGLPSKTITEDSIKEFIGNGGTKRINFRYNQTYALHKDDDGTGWLNLPFDQTFEPLAKNELGMDRVLFQNKNTGKYYRLVKSEEEYLKIKQFIEKYKDMVFLRDCLDLSIALSMHDYYDEETLCYTNIGQHEQDLKYHSDVKDTSEDLKALTSELQLRLDQLPYFKKVDYIIAVPGSKTFMQDIINGLEGFGFENKSDLLSWTNKKNDSKSITDPNEKLEDIKTWGLEIDSPELLNGKSILLIDDMYKSGVTMQYIAMKLKEAGVKRVFGICLCKSMGNNNKADQTT